MNKHSMDMNKRHSHNYVCIFLQVCEQVSMHVSAMHVHKHINKHIHMLVCVTLKTVNDCHGWGYLVHHQISQNI